MNVNLRKKSAALALQTMRLADNGTHATLGFSSGITEMHIIYAEMEASNIVS
jgi:hypothetical protein